MTLSRRLVTVGVLLLLGLGCSSNKSGPDKEPRYLLALVEFVEDSATILKAKALHDPPHQSIPGPPSLTSDTWHAFKDGAKEFVAVLHDLEGSVQRVYGIPATSRANYDLFENGRISGGAITPEKHHRVIAIPVHPDAGTLSFHQTQVHKGSGSDSTRIAVKGDRSLHSTVLKYVEIVTHSSGKVRAKSLDNHHLVNLPDLLMHDAPLDTLNWRVSGSDKLVATNKPIAKPAGKLLKKKNLVVNGETDSQFNIVVMGDGFASDEIDLYEDLVETFQDYFFTQAPFDSLADHINMYALSTSSQTSGISHCSDSTTFETYYHLRGDFSTGTPYRYPGFIGTHHPQAIYEAGEEIVPWEHTDLYLMIANCEVEGGGGWGDLNIAFINTGADTGSYFQVTALHEIGHAVGKFAEEYLSAYPDQGLHYPNMTRQAQVDSNTVPWKNLAFPSELNADGSFKYVHVAGDPFVPGITTFPCYPELKNGTGYPEDGYRVGLIWGGQDIPADLANAKPEIVCGLMDLRGKDYYRASPWCRMRMQYWDFCRVCQHALVKRILQPKKGSS